MIITLLTGKTSKLKERIKDELGLEIKVLRSSRSKKMTLKIDSKSQTPTLSIPTLCTNKHAFEFIENNLVWIKSKMLSAVKLCKFEDGENITIFGQEIKIEHHPELRSGVILKDNILKVSGELEFLHRRVKDFIKKLAKEKFYETSKLKAEKIGCKLNNVVIKDTKSRWGSCSSNNNINYNWRIALAPYFVFEYLTSHEVAHLKHHDHSRNFWNCVKELSPQYLEGKNWLKNNNRTILKYE